MVNKNSENILWADAHMTYLLSFLSGLFADEGYKLSARASSLSDIKKLLKKETSFSVAIVNPELPNDGDGEKAVELIRRQKQNIKVISLAFKKPDWSDENWELDETVGDFIRMISEVRKTRV